MCQQIAQECSKFKATLFFKQSSDLLDDQALSSRSGRRVVDLSSSVALAVSLANGYGSVSVIVVPMVEWSIHWMLRLFNAAELQMRSHRRTTSDWLLVQYMHARKIVV